MGYRVLFKHAIPGDLVMAHVLDIKHPVFDTGTIDRSFVVFGIVKKIVQVQWKTGMRDGKLVRVFENHECLNVNWVHVPQWNSTLPAPPMCNNWINLLS